MKKKTIVVLLLIILIIQVIAPIKINVVQANSDTGVFDDSITLEWGPYYNGGGDLLSYGWFEPSNSNDAGNIPLIVWLHGADEAYKGENELLDSGLPRIINNKTLKGFSSYVLCPHLYNSGSSEWHNSTIANKLDKTIDKFIAEHPNVDTSNIILVGHSYGGMGTLYMAQNKPNKFSKFIVLSGYDFAGLDSNQIADKITYWYSETGLISQMNKFKDKIGSEKCFDLGNISHGSVPEKAFTDDTGTRVRNRQQW